jgi:hypothetical protein
MAALIEARVCLDAAEAIFMRGFTDAPLVNWNGIEVEWLRAAPALRAWRLPA